MSVDARPVSQGFLPGESHVACARPSHRTLRYDRASRRKLRRFRGDHAAGWRSQRDLQSGLASAAHRGDVIAGTDIERVITADGESLCFGVRAFQRAVS